MTHKKDSILGEGMDGEHNRIKNYEDFKALVKQHKTIEIKVKLDYNLYIRHLITANEDMDIMDYSFLDGSQYIYEDPEFESTTIGRMIATGQTYLLEK